MGPFSFILEVLTRQCVSLAEYCKGVLPWLVLALAPGIVMILLIWSFF